MNDKLAGNSNPGRNQRTNSTGLHHVKGSGPQRSQRYEAIISLYDKLLEDEDKLLLQAKRKEARERKLQRELAAKNQTDAQRREAGRSQYQIAMSEEDDDIEDDSIDLDDDEDDMDDDLLSDEMFHDHDNQSYLDEGGEGDLTKGVDLDDLQTYHNQHFGVELNASTADFNKEIK